MGYAVIRYDELFSWSDIENMAQCIFYYPPLCCMIHYSSLLIVAMSYYIHLFGLGKTIVLEKNHNMCDEFLEKIGSRKPVSLSLIRCRGNLVTSRGLRELFRRCAENLEVVWDFSY